MTITTVGIDLAKNVFAVLRGLETGNRLWLLCEKHPRLTLSDNGLAISQTDSQSIFVGSRLVTMTFSLAITLSDQLG